MKKIMWIIVSLAVGGYLVNSYIETKAKRESERADRTRIEQATKLAVTQLVSRTGAVDNWDSRLSKGEKYRLESVRTIELEHLWLQKKPILFVGTILDIATHDQSHYRVSLQRSLLANLEYMFATELRLSLLSEKEQMDSFLKEHPDLFKDLEFKNGVAVVARINAIRTLRVSGKEGGDEKETKIGEGELVEIIYTGDVMY